MQFNMNETETKEKDEQIQHLQEQVDQLEDALNEKEREEVERKDEIFKLNF